MTDRKQAARQALDLVGDAPVPARQGWLTARRAASLGVIAFALAGLAVIGCVVLLYVQVQAEPGRAERAAALAADKVQAELDRRTAQRDREDAARDRAVRDAVCTVLPDLPSPSGDVQRLARALNCPVPVPAADPVPDAGADAGAGTTRPGTSAVAPQPTTPPTTPAPAGDVPPAPSPAATQPPQPAPEPEPSPSGPVGQIVCPLLPLPGVCP